MPQFQPDQVSFGDLPGYAAWDISHGREHIQFVQSLAARTPAVLITDFDLLTFLTAGGARPSIVQSHAQAHTLLRAALGITGVDLSAFNLDDQGSFYDFLSYNAEDHILIRQQLGLL
jgi:hypothetical protein